MFAAPGSNSSCILSTGWDVKKALAFIWKKLGEDAQDTAKRLAFTFVEREHGPLFARAIQELTAHFVGRDDQIRQVFDWIHSDRVTPEGRQMWIGGKAGCGKSAFMAALAHQSLKDEEWFAVPYFFDPKWTRKRRSDDFFRYAAMQIASEYGIDLDQVRYEEPEEQFRFAYTNFVHSQSTRLIFLLDGLDETEDSLDDLAAVVREATGCVWIFAGQETERTDVLRRLPSLMPFPLGGLNDEGMRAMIAEAASDASRQFGSVSDQLTNAILRNAEGLPQYTRLAIAEWKRVGNALNPSALPKGLPEYYTRIIERLRTGGDFTQQWRGDVIHILALLATARRGRPLSAATIAAMLTRYVRPYSENEIEAALEACTPILRSLRSDSESDERQWTFSHNSFRQFILKGDDSFIEDIRNRARKALEEVCYAWDKNLENGVRAYALQFLVEELTEAGRYQDICDLALKREPANRKQSFLDAQASKLGPRFALQTLACAIDLAFSSGNLPDAVALTLARAQRIEETYSESPFAAMRARNNQWAFELIERIENQHDRTLWHLAFAVFHANGQRPHLAAQILDEVITIAALREKLVGGASMCAAVLLSLLTEVPTRRFQWDRFLSRLDDASKRHIIPLLVTHIRPPINCIWQVLRSIADRNLRDEARRDVVRELAASDPRFAEFQLSRFEDNFDRSFSAVEVVAAYARLRRWNDAQRVLDDYVSRDAVRQRAQALAHLAAELNRAGLRDDAKRAFFDGLDTIKLDLAEKPDQQAKAYAEFGHVQAEAGFFQQADIAFRSAMRIAFKLKGSHIFRAICFTTLVTSLSAATEFFPNLQQMLSDALAEAEIELTQSEDHKVESTRRRLVNALGRSGHRELATRLLDSIQDKTIHLEATGRLCSYYHRFDRAVPQSLIKKMDKASGLDGKMMFHALVGLEKAKDNRAAALSEVCASLRHPKPNWRASYWGPSRLLGEAGSVLTHYGDHRAPRIFDAAVVKLGTNKCGIGDNERGRHLVNIAIHYAECGNPAAACRTLLLTRQCLRKMKDKGSQVALWAEVESVETRYHLKDKYEEPIGETVLEDIEQTVRNSKSVIADKLGLYSELIAPFAEAGRVSDLQFICAFAFERITDARFLNSLPKARNAQRSLLPGLRAN